MISLSFCKVTFSGENINNSVDNRVISLCIKRKYFSLYTQIYTITQCLVLINCKRMKNKLNVYKNIAKERKYKCPELPHWKIHWSKIPDTLFIIFILYYYWSTYIHTLHKQVLSFKSQWLCGEQVICSLPNENVKTCIWRNWLICITAMLDARQPSLLI